MDGWVYVCMHVEYLDKRGGPKGKCEPKNCNKGGFKVGENGGCSSH